MKPDQTPPILGAGYNLNLHVLQRISRFPKGKRILGAELSQGALKVLTLLAEANATRNCSRRLERLDLVLATIGSLRVQLRLAYDLRCLAHGEHTHVSAQLEDMARQLEGWIKYTAHSSGRNKT